jgi:hypothetical protein
MIEPPHPALSPNRGEGKGEGETVLNGRRYLRELRMTIARR